MFYARLGSSFYICPDHESLLVYIGSNAGMVEVSRAEIRGVYTPLSAYPPGYYQQWLQERERQKQQQLEAQRKKELELENQRKEAEVAAKFYANKFRIGCDPEFVFISPTGTQIGARGLCPSLGKVGTAGSAGYDAGDVAELRPSPDFSSYRVVANLRKLMLAPHFNPARTYIWRAGAYPNNQPLGGHIHFERSAPGWKSIGAKSPLVGAPTIAELRKEKTFQCLNSLVRIMEKLDLLPQKECKERLKTGYGKLSGSVRTDREQTIEYRRMCSWLHHPRIAFLALSIAKLVAADPKACAPYLGPRAEWKSLVSMLEYFSKADLDARRATERLLCFPLSKIQSDPTANFRPHWEAWEPEVDKSNA